MSGNHADTSRAIPIPRKIDAQVNIQFDMKHPRRSVIRTNANASGLEELLELWLRGQIGQGSDERSPAERDIYAISIGLDLSDDTLFTNSNTGNKSLTCGCVRWVFAHLADYRIEPLQ